MDLLMIIAMLGLGLALVLLVLLGVTWWLEDWIMRDLEQGLDDDQLLDSEVDE